MMDSANGHFDLQKRVALYRQFDETRQIELESLAADFLKMQSMLNTLQSDLEDEKVTRRNWKKRAEEAENAIQRNKFIAVLIDGDGYIFREMYLRAISESGGGDAGHALYTEVLNCLHANGILSTFNSEPDIMVNVYANKNGLSQALCDSGMIMEHNQLEQFFCSFSQCRTLFQFVDCGPGRETIDAKLRDTFRFYAYNAQCSHIFLGCCHDGNYISELDKYRHDQSARSKITLIQAASNPQLARAYSSLPFPIIRFDTVFEQLPLEAKVKAEQIYPSANHSPKETNHTIPELQPTANEPSPPASKSSFSSTVTPAQPKIVSPILPIGPPPKVITPPEVEEEKPEKPEKQTKQENTNQPTGDPKTGIPINRSGQRIDRVMRQPATAEQERFDSRIKYRKLCNEHHLRGNCGQQSCKYDHDPIDDEMKNTLRYKARGIPCSAGMKCRRSGCYFGHQCPWGNKSCSNPKCAFIRNGLHSINDLEIAKFAQAVVT